MAEQAKKQETKKEDVQEKFIGPNKIKEFIVSSRSTYFKHPVVDVEYENGEKESFPQAVFEKIVTNEVSDWAELRNKIAVPIVASLLGVLLEAECPIGHLEYVISKLKASMEENTKNAESILWKKNVEDLTVMDIHQVLLAKK